MQVPAIFHPQYSAQFTVPLLTLLCGMSFNAAAQQTTSNPDSVTNEAVPFLRGSYCWSPSFYPYYKPEELSSLSKLPDSALNNLKQQLINKLGERFYNSMEFCSGQHVNLQQLSMLEQRDTNRKWTVATYYLCFTCKQLPEQKGYYVARIELDAQGRMLLPVDLPNIVQDTARARVISWQSATKIARRNGIRKVEASLSYSPPLDIMVWVFHSSKQIRRGLARKKEIYINANNGHVLEKYDYRQHYAPF